MSPGRTALSLASAQIGSLVRLDSEATVAGTMRLGGAVIRGTLALHGSISQPEDASVVGGSTMTVSGAVFLTGLRTHGGRVTLTGATLGSLSAQNARLSNACGEALTLSGATVQGSVRLVHDFAALGTVVLDRARIGGRLQLTGGSFAGPDAGGPEPGCAIGRYGTPMRDVPGSTASRSMIRAPTSRPRGSFARMAMRPRRSGS